MNDENTGWSSQAEAVNTLSGFSKELSRSDSLECIREVTARYANILAGSAHCVVSIIVETNQLHNSGYFDAVNSLKHCEECTLAIKINCVGGANVPTFYTSIADLNSACSRLSQCDRDLTSIVPGTLYAPLVKDSRITGAIAFIPAGGSAAFSAFQQSMAALITTQCANAISSLHVTAWLKEAELAIRRLTEAQAMSHVGSWEVDLSTDMTYWSDELYRIGGFDPTHGLPSDDEFISRYHPDDIKRRDERISRSLEAGEPHEAEVRLLMPNGSLKWVQTTSRTETDADGKPVRLYGTTVDITNRKLAELSHTRFLRIIEESSDFITIANQDGQLLYCNATMRDLLGITEDEVPFTNVRQAHTAESWTKYSAKIPALYAEGRLSGETELMHHDGRRIPISVNVVVHTEDDGRSSYRSAIARDISELKRNERALSLARERLKHAIEVAQIGSWELDVTTGRAWVSEEFFRMCGKDVPDATISKEDLLELYGPEGRIRVEAALDNAIKTGTGYELELSRPDATGHHRGYYAIGKAVAEPGGEVANIVHTCMDITRRQELEHQLRQSQKMETIGTFAGAIAHDFNNLLAVIQGYSEQALETLTPGTELHDVLDVVLGATGRAATLTQQLLAFARKQAISPTVLQLNDVIKRTADMLRPLAGASVRIATELDPVLGMACIDSNQFEQVLVNLVINSRDALSEGGDIVIRTRNETVAANDSHVGLEGGRYAVVEVSDNGPGMSDEVKERIFEPFFTTKPKGKGTGLGLSTVYSIVTQNGGTVTVDSSPGEGATLSVYLPYVERTIAPSAPEATAADVNRPSKASVLLVDDEAMLRGLTATALERKGFNDVQAADGMEAAHLIQNGSLFDILVTDIMMPRLGGIELAKRFQDAQPKSPILLISGFSEDIFDDAQAHEPHLPLMRKPFRMRDLVDRVNELLAATT